MVEIYWFNANPNICLYLKYMPINRTANCSEGIYISFCSCCWWVEHSSIFWEISTLRTHQRIVCGLSHKYDWDNNKQTMWIMRFASFFGGMVRTISNFWIVWKSKAIWIWHIVNFFGHLSFSIFFSLYICFSTFWPKSSKN